MAKKKQIKIENNIIIIRFKGQIIKYSLDTFEVIEGGLELLEEIYLDDGTIKIDDSAKWLYDLTWEVDPDEGHLEELLLDKPYLLFLILNLKLRMEDVVSCYIMEGVRLGDKKGLSTTHRLLGISHDQLEYLSSKIDIYENCYDFCYILKAMNGDTHIFDDEEDDYLPKKIYKELLKIK